MSLLEEDAASAGLPVLPAWQASRSSQACGGHLSWEGIDPIGDTSWTHRPQQLNCAPLAGGMDQGVPEISPPLAWSEARNATTFATSCG